MVMVDGSVNTKAEQLANNVILILVGRLSMAAFFPIMTILWIIIRSYGADWIDSHVTSPINSIQAKMVIIEEGSNKEKITNTLQDQEIGELSKNIESISGQGKEIVAKMNDLTGAVREMTAVIKYKDDHRVP